MATANPTYNPPGNIDGCGYYLQRAAALMGATDPRQIGFMFEDFDQGEGNFRRVLSTSGLLRTVTNRHPGWYEIDTGATAGSAPQLMRGTATGSFELAMFPAGTAGVWYLGFRGFSQTALSTAQTTIGTQMVDRITPTTNRAQLGKLAGSANWCFKADGGGGATIDSGVSATGSTAVVVEVVRVGGLTYLYVDEALKGTPSDTFPTTVAALALVSGTNGTDAVSRNLLVDWVAAGVNGRSST